MHHWGQAPVVHLLLQQRVYTPNANHCYSTAE